MKAWVLNEIGSINLSEVKKPEPSDEEVLVEVHAAGICGSDIPRVYENGAHHMPLVIGHEFSGRVIAAGRDVNKSWLGKRVGVFPLIPCRSCTSCLNRQYEMCRHYSYLGSRQDGGFAEYVSVPQWNLIELPENVSYEAAAMLEPMAVAVHAMRRLEIKEDSMVVIYGLGTIGMLLLIFLLERGMKSVFVVGNKDFQRDEAVRMGLSEACFCDSRMEDAVSWCFQKTQGQGMDVIFECVGKQDIYADVIRMAAPLGKICLVGNPYTDMRLKRNTYWDILRHELQIFGTWNSSFLGADDKEAQADDWHYVLDRLSEGVIQPENLITHKLSFAALEDGLNMMREKTGNYIKVMCVR